MSDTPSSPVDMICRSMKRFFHIKVFMAGLETHRLDLPLKGTGHNYKSCFCREWLQIQTKSQTFRNSQEVVPKTGDDNRCFQHDPAKPYIGPDFTYEFAVFLKFLRE
ncbi:unnamed protein product [Prunus armeniaca]|uniref:Uncharacterized protein n=1 Tax=Prunus armeniaca TaxID=36596 RepID=A0A6J5XSS9_PRUAR|nr:unnamed protein product [Prunus armeniaca]